ncbi:hypothetical protein JCM8097_003712 [Rhodosporidiobolus ruineniae]
MAALPELPNVHKLSQYVTRILGQNPSKYTLQGTNSYLVHHPSSPSLLLLDTTGPSSAAGFPAAAEQAYLSSLRSAILDHPTQPAHVTDIVLTHWHKDHVGALRGVVEMLAELHAKSAGEGVRVWKLPTTPGDAWAKEPGQDEDIEALLAGSRAGAVAAADDGQRVRALQPGQRFRFSPDERLTPPSSSQDADAVQLEVIHTPGHTSDSICLTLSSASDLSSDIPASSSHSSSSAPCSPSSILALFTADTILGHGTAVFASLASYLRSLSSLIDLLRSASAGSGGANEVPLYPGHGEVIPDGLKKVEEYKAHREERERQVVEALRAIGDGKSVRASDLTDQIYGSTIPSSLKPAATHGLLLHLAKLHEEGQVERIEADEVEELAAEEAGGGEVAIPPGWNDGWRWTGSVPSSSAQPDGRL